jgi:hypothetical protein
MFSEQANAGEPGWEIIWAYLNSSPFFLSGNIITCIIYRGADKFLARPGRKQARATEDFDFHISYL